MRFLLDPWRRIGARLYLALGFAVLLTLGSSAVAVYYFERSGDLNHRVQTEAEPALDASWAAAREAERLLSLGLRLMVQNAAGVSTDTATASLERLESYLTAASVVPALLPAANEVHEGAYALVGVIDQLAVYQAAVQDNDVAATELGGAIEGLSVDGESRASLRRALLASDQAELDRLWDQIAVLPLGEQVYAVRGQQLALRAQANGFAATLDERSVALEDSVTGLLATARAESQVILESSVRSFDEGRIILAVISIASVLAATLSAWLWVGQGVVRRLSRLSERMRGMASGDLETPIPEVSRDEIGELAGALEVWRQQALEVQRLNLVERLYGELREVNEELQRMQARLVAQEKLAALGELVSGVAHEISNPLNFVKNFTEGSLELQRELMGMLTSYRGQMTEDDAGLLDDISEELATSLERVQSNGGRALAIVERMRGLGVVGGDPEPTDLNGALRSAVRLACEAFHAEWRDFSVEPDFDLDRSVGDVSLVANDFSEAVVGLVSNACYALRQKRDAQDGEYEPGLSVSSRLSDGLVEVRVRDNGPGIPDEVVGQIFDPFFSTREGVVGAGLGLPIAADVMRRLGGDLVVDTVHGEYTEFTMTLPAGSTP